MHIRELQQYTQHYYNNAHKQLQQYTQDNCNNTRDQTNNNYTQDNLKLATINKVVLDQYIHCNIVYL